MELDFVPRSQLAQRLADGWSLLPGHDYRPGDWAILMVAPPDGFRPAETGAPSRAVALALALARLAPPPRRAPIANVVARALGRVRTPRADREPA